MDRKYKTRSKQSIETYLKMQTGRSFTARDLYNYLEEKQETMNLTTVYRNLDKLADEGILMKYKNPEEGSARYQYGGESSCKDHIHMQCNKCGKIYHMECHFMKEIAEHLEEHHGFKLDCSGSMLNGLCDKCQTKSIKANE
ncbi:MAG: transcriptional repressor [Lachnospiraceae bacterium]|nr:transcriptional repressor [Lachnospiraceae bacterium]